MKLIAIATTMLLLTTVCSDPTGTPEFKHPVIKKHGGIVVLPEAAHQPRANSKVLLDITSDEKSGSILKGLDRAALILNQYAEAGVGADNGFKMAIVFHGPATTAALTDEAFARHSKPYLKEKGQTKNPNLELIAQLKRSGVEVFVCGQALSHQGFATSEVAADVTIAVSAATVNINLQMDGYAAIPFH